MVHAESSITVNREAKEVFELVRDPSNHWRWRDDVTSAQAASQGPVRVGSSCTWMLRSPLGKGVPMEVEVVALEPGRRVEFRGTSGSMRVLFTYLFFEEEAGRTTVRRVADVECAPPMPEVLFRRRMRQRNSADLRGLKDYLEAPGAEQDLLDVPETAKSDTEA